MSKIKNPEIDYVESHPDTTSYLGHFAQRRYLSQGHNDSGGFAGGLAQGISSVYGAKKQQEQNDYLKDLVDKATKSAGAPTTTDDSQLPG